MTTTPTTAEPTRETLASLLAALHYGQYADNDEHASLKRNIERALKDFDIGRCEFATPAEIAQPATPEPSDAYFLSRAAQFLEWYADWIKRKVMSADIEEHPYLPELEEVAERLRAQASALQAAIPAQQPAAPTRSYLCPETDALCGVCRVRCRAGLADHIEQRIRAWRQRTMNKSGDHLALDDFMGQDSIDDLIDFVCDEWALAAAQPAAQQPAVEQVARTDAEYWEQGKSDSIDRAMAYEAGTWFQARNVDEMQRFYRARLPAIREAAREHGYAIGVHGSERRDFDLIACAWREGASGPDTLAHAIAMAACGITREGPYAWEQKPLGRVAVSIPVCWTARRGVTNDGHIDLSVALASPAAQPATSQQTGEKP